MSSDGQRHEADPIGRRRALRLGLSLVWQSHRTAACVLATTAVAQGMVLWVGLVLGAAALRSALGGSGLLRVGLVLVVVAVAQEGLSAAGGAVGTMLRQDVGAEISTRALASLRGVPFEQVEDNAWQGSVGLALREAAYRPGFLVDNAVSVVQAAAALIGVFAGAVGVLGPEVLLLPVIVLPVLALEARLRRQLVAVQTHAAPDLMRMQFLAQMSVDADWQRDVRASGSDIVETEYGRLAGAYLRRLRGTLVSTTVWRTLAGVALSSVVVLTDLELLARSDTKPEPTRVAILLGVLALSGGYLRSLVSTSGELFTSAEYLSILFTVLGPLAPVQPDNPRQVTEPDAGADTVAAGSRATPRCGLGPTGRVELRDVRYTYQGREHAAVAGISLRLQPGLIALTGPNGAGKTTIVKILAGLLSPQSGTLTALDSTGTVIPWPVVDRAVLFQNAAHLRFSVRQNVTLGRDDYRGRDDDGAVWAALEAAGLDHAVSTLPQGLDTIVGAGFGADADLSGGQWQRLALARLLYADAPVIVCDEPATGLDASGEARLMEHLTHLAADRLVVVVTHRPETIARCSRAITIVDGRVTADTALVSGQSTSEATRGGPDRPWLGTDSNCELGDEAAPNGHHLDQAQSNQRP